MKRLVFITFVILISISIIFMSCSTPASAPAQTTPGTAPATKYGGTIRIAYTQAQSTSMGWPVDTASSGSENYVGITCENLETLDYTGTPQPVLASSWQVAPDGKSITFTLRKGVKFHDGSDWNANVAKFNLDAYFNAKRSGTALWTSIDVVDPYTVRINIKSFQNSIWFGLSSPQARMYSQEAFNKNGLDWVRTHPVGTGPYKLVSYQRDVISRFEKFDNYWQQGKPYMDGIEFKVIGDLMTQQAAFLAGEVDVMALSGMAHDKTKADLLAKGYIIKPPPGGAAISCLIPDSNNASSPFAKKQVREAVEYAIDKEAIAKALGFGLEVPNYQPVHPRNVGYVSNLAQRKYDPEKAKQLLKEAGYPNGFETSIIQSTYVTKDHAVVVQNYLKAVGINANIDVTDNTRLADMRAKGWNNGLMYYTFANRPNFAWIVEQFYAPLSPDLISLQRPAGMPEVLNAALAAQDSNSQTATAQKLVTFIWENAMLIPVLASTSGGYATTKNVHDGGFGEFTFPTDWDQADVWLSK